MSTIGHLLVQPLTVQTMSGTSADEYGNTVPAAAGAPLPVLGYLEQQTSVEFILDRETTVSKWVAYLPAGTVIGPLDHIGFQGQTFQVDGEPQFVWNPRVREVDHIEAALVVVT
ncbi:hypothetical protein [Leifsonia sp. NPDC058248]|uniref:hypothetical protein n=1 Tax=Leifsonia sp. NPDC058248 TaxID=3346402 RepID=UPI0036D822B7